MDFGGLTAIRRVSLAEEGWQAGCKEGEWADAHIGREVKSREGKREGEKQAGRMTRGKEEMCSFLLVRRATSESELRDSSDAVARVMCSSARRSPIRCRQGAATCIHAPRWFRQKT